MNRRSLIVILLALAASVTLLAGSYLIAQRWCVRQVASSADDLDWLRQEFRLSDAEIARVRELHDGYMPKCLEMCRQIAVKKSELETALTGTTNLTTAAEQKLTELGALRAECQAQMLRHFAEVSQAMPPEQGRRYLAEMQRLTLGFHEQIEQSMSQPKSTHHEHGHH
jgi:hypothetical protein